IAASAIARWAGTACWRPESATATSKVQIELRHLRYFLAVADELNFSRAAKSLHIAQPALSSQIRAFETQLGCRLFERTTRRVELTPSGEMLLEDAREIVSRADQTVSKLV